MKIARVFAVLIMLVPQMAAQDRFLSMEQQQKLLTFKGEKPPLPKCSEGENVPLAVIFSPNGKDVQKASFWEKSKKGWLHGMGARVAIQQAIAYIQKASILITGKKPTHLIVRIPCAQ